MIRNILGILAGIAAAVATVIVGEGIGHAVFPPPAGVDLAKPEALKTIIDQLPLGAIVAVLLAWGTGALIGSGVAARITGRPWSAWAIGVAMLLAGFATLLEIPHPLWFMIASVPTALVPAWLAGRLFTPVPPAPAP